jgi:small conductance mechanosensitive channel
MSDASGFTTLASQEGSDLADRFSNLSFTAGDAVLTLAIIILSWLLSRLARRATTRAAARVSGVSDDLQNLGARLAGYIVLFVGVGVALSVLGVQIQPVLTVAILAGVVLVLALRGIADNFAAGVVIQTRLPVRLGDEIDTAGFVGVVMELNSRAVVIATYDGRTVHVPNSKLLDEPIVNHSTASRRRSEVEVRARAEGDESTLADLLADAASTASGVLADPAPVALITSVEPERVTMTVRFWHGPTTAGPVTSAVVSSLAGRLRDAGRPATVVAPPPDVPLTPQAPL